MWKDTISSIFSYFALFLFQCFSIIVYFHICTFLASFLQMVGPEVQSKQNHPFHSMFSTIRVPYEKSAFVALSRITNVVEGGSISFRETLFSQPYSKGKQYPNMEARCLNLRSLYRMPL